MTHCSAPRLASERRLVGQIANLPDILARGIHDSPEDQLLLHCARISLTAIDREALVELTRGPLDWDAVLARSVRQGIAILVYRHLTELAPQINVPRPIAEQFAQIEGATRLQVMRQRYEVVRLLDRLGLLTWP